MKLWDRFREGAALGQMFPVIALTFFVASCSNPKVVQTSAPLFGSNLAAATNHLNPLSSEARAALSHSKLIGEYRADPDEAIRSLRSELQSSESVELRTALIDLCQRAGRKQADPYAAAGYFVAASEIAYEGLEKGGAVSSQYLPLYNESCGEAAEAFVSVDSFSDGIEVDGPFSDYRIRTKSGGDEYVDISEFTQLYPAEDLEFRHIDLDRKIRPGIGSAMVGQYQNTEAHLKANPFLPPPGLMIPANVTLEFRNGGNVDFACRDLNVVNRATVGGVPQTLAADYTAPFAMLLNSAPKQNVGWDGMLHPEEYEDKMGLFQVEAFREDQIPVIFVHGLMSSPKVWVDALNELHADPVLRAKYQVLVFFYPTGFPVIYNAHSLREKMKAFREAYDPRGMNPDMRNMIMIGHSMGGQLTNLQIRNSGSAFTSEFFDRPIEDLGNTPEEQKEILRELLIFEANPDISRVVFLASPHRGSDLATSPLGKLGRDLMKIPQYALSCVPDPDIKGLTAVGRELLLGRPDSIESLAPNSPGLLTILRMPVRKGVVIHSVIGNHKMKQPLEDSSDTVVPYWSSHLAAARSEAIVDSTHTKICENDDAIEEVRRILYQHIGRTP